MGKTRLRYEQPRQLPLFARPAAQPAEDGRASIVIHVVRSGGALHAVDLVRWMRSQGWTRGQGEWDLRALVADARLLRMSCPETGAVRYEVPE